MSGDVRDLVAELAALDARWDRSRDDMMNAGTDQIAATLTARDGRVAELDADPELQALAVMRWNAAEEARAAPRRLAAELGMPKDATPMHAPPLTEGCWRVEMFGEKVTDGPPITGPAAWPLYQAGPGPMSEERLDRIWGDSLPADERARMIAGVPALTIRAWQIIVRRDTIAPFIEARRDRSGRWEVAIRGLGSNPTSELVRQILPGLTRIRRQITRSGGRPPGSGKRPDEVRAAVEKWRTSSGAPGKYPTPSRLGRLLNPPVETETARKYLRQMRSEEAKKAGK